MGGQEKTKFELPKDVNELRKFLKDRKPDLVINTVPKDALEKFKKLAEEHFENHYGFALKWLIDMYLPQNLEILGRLEEIEARLDALENKPESEQIKTIGGKIIEKKK